MSNGVKLALLGAVLFVAGSIVVLGRSGGEQLEVKDTVEHSNELQTGFCPWRQPRQDLQALFPGASDYMTEDLVLSRLRQPILHRLGTGARLASNLLRAYPVMSSGKHVGVVLVQAAPGEYGAVEVVVGLGEDGSVRGVRIQRLREPPEIAQAITSESWLGAFMGKTAGSALKVGMDLPEVPGPARLSASAVALTVRSLLVEYDEGRGSAAQHEATTHP